MRDGILLAQRGLPSIALVTERFWEQGHQVAFSAGMTGIPRVKLPHPLAGATTEQLLEAARKAVPDIVAAWEGWG